MCWCSNLGNRFPSCDDGGGGGGMSYVFLVPPITKPRAIRS